MVNALVYHVASGQAFFTGVALILIAGFSAFRTGGDRPAAYRRVLAYSGLILIAISATPLPGWFYCTAGTLTLAWIVFVQSTRTTPRRASRWLCYAMIAVWWLGMALELPYHVSPTVPQMGSPPVDLIGDSLSAGMGVEAETWPRMLARRHRVVVNDLSLPGATVATALKQAEHVNGPTSLVLAEIGGNDVLGGTALGDFERDLDRLLSKLREGGRTVILLELPLPPFSNRYGAVQRRLARQHQVLLIPKRVLLGVLTTAGATLDTVHLSRQGHALMAETMWNVIRRAFSKRIE